MGRCMQRMGRIVSFVFGVLLIINAFFLITVANFNLGTILTLLLGIVLVLYSAFLYKFIVINFAVSIGVLMLVVFIAFIFAYGSNDNAQNDEDAVIVLGAGVRGERVTLTLKYRLDKAISYAEINDKAIIVLSGGKGAQEKISEAEAMKRYLLTKNIDGNRIVTEDKSTSTYENFLFSKLILDKKLKSNYKVVFVTNSFHVYRANCTAKRAGFESVAHISAKVEWYTAISNYLRECLAVLKMWLID